MYEEIKDKLPEKVFPITTDPGGNFVCYDFRDDENNPEVSRWDHEQKFLIEDGELINPEHEWSYGYYHLDFVAKSFTEALTNLYDVEVEEFNSWKRFQDTEKLERFSGENLIQVNRIRALQGLPPIAI